MLRRAARAVVTFALAEVVVAPVAWSAIALWFDGPQSRVVAGAIAGGVVAARVVAAVRVRPRTPKLVAALVVPSQNLKPDVLMM